MKLVVDIEANALYNPTQIWVIVCKDIDTGKLHIFRRVTEDASERQKALDLLDSASLVVGHNWLGYDLPVGRNLLGPSFASKSDVIDTLVLSKLVDYSRPAGHSIEAYGEEFGCPKIKFHDFTKYSQEMEDYCVRDVEICHKIYCLYLRHINDPDWASAILLEQRFQLYVVNRLEQNGFAFNHRAAALLCTQVEKDLAVLDKDILDAFPPREVLIREFTPKATKHGTISRSSVPRLLHSNIHDYEVGTTYRHTKSEPFNPSSHRQIVTVLIEAGWRPEDKTQTHIDAERELNRLRYKREKTQVDLEVEESIVKKLEILRKTGWKVNETNLNTLPPSAPKPARLLAKRILLESRRRTLTEWIGLCSDKDRIHGRFYGIGAWTHRMAHQKPNTANIPNELDTAGKTKLLGKELRQLWCAPKKRLLVGVDAEGIQLRIFAHYIDDKEFTDALVNGKKEKKTDPHSLNQRILGDVCKSRAAAKRFIYALLLGAGQGKLSQILGCSGSESRSALDRLMERYTGFDELKRTIMPRDARRGWFLGLDGRHVLLPGSTERDNRHLCMSGYLQNGEAIVMKKATLKWTDLLAQDNAILVNLVHDEWQTETPNNMEIALRIAEMQSNSLKIVGEELGLKCPLAGSYYNDDHKDYTVGTNWYQTH